MNKIKKIQKLLRRCGAAVTSWRWKSLASACNPVRIIDSFARRYNGGKALVFLSIIVVANLIAMAFYFNDSRLAHRAAKRDAVIQKIVNVIHLLEATPIKDRVRALSAMNDPDLRATITAKPSFKLQFNDISFWQINKALREQFNSFSVSIELQENQWLNVNATIYTHFLAEQLVYFVMEIVVFGFVILLIWSVNRFTRPLENFKEAVDRLSMDLDTNPVAVDGPTVVQEAAEAMNNMQQRIQELIRNRTKMLAAISHDLRTPITRMKLRAQFINDDDTKNELIEDLGEMEAMVNETLAFARDDSDSKTKSLLDLVSLVESACEAMLDMGYNVKFKCKKQRIKIFGHPISLKRAVNNLLSNAVRYAENVTVTMRQEKDHVIVLFEDDGPGIAEKELDQVFEPFYRGEQSRSRDTGGVGLGLAVTHDVILSHNGSIGLKNRSGGGLAVTVALPLELS